MTLNPIALGVGGLLTCAILCVVAYLGSRGNTEADEVARRLSAYAASSEQAPQTERIKTGNALRDALDSFTDALNPVLARGSHAGKLAEDLQKADLRMKSSEWVLAVIGIGFVVGLLLSLRFGSLLPLPIAMLVVWFGAGFYLRIRQRRRTRAFENQLGDTIVLLSNALKAGLSFAQAMSTVAKNASPPIADEFGRATREIALGIAVDDALNHMVERNRSEDFDLLVTAVQIQRVVGGNLAEILDTIAFTIRERVRIMGEIRTLTAQARASGLIITLLPIGLAIFLAVLQPSYFGPMIKEPFGLIMLAVGLFSISIGAAIIQKIVKIEV
jgi:tight adherence protein B